MQIGLDDKYTEPMHKITTMKEQATTELTEEQLVTKLSSHTTEIDAERIKTSDSEISLNANHKVPKDIVKETSPSTFEPVYRITDTTFDLTKESTSKVTDSSDHNISTTSGLYQPASAETRKRTDANDVSPNGFTKSDESVEKDAGYVNSENIRARHLSKAYSKVDEKMHEYYAIIAAQVSND